MNLNQLKVFHEVANCQSFTKASQVLCLTQPGISKHIKQLEAYYGLKLFDRLGKKVVTTQAGDSLFEYTKKIFDLFVTDVLKMYILRRFENDIIILFFILYILP